MAEPYSERAHKQIQVESWSNSARELLLRGYSEAGAFAESHTTNADRSVATDTFEVHGDPISVTVSPLTGPVRRGECYVRVTLMMDGEPVKRLMAAYLTDGKTLAWPPGVHEGMTEGPGRVYTLTGTDPAPGAEIVQAVPTNARWKLLALRFTYITDATVTNRRVSTFIDDGTTNLNQVPCAIVQTASQNRKYSAVESLGFDPGIAGLADFHLPLPPIPLAQGFRIRTETVNHQAGDDFSLVTLTVEEWIEE